MHLIIGAEMRLVMANSGEPHARLVLLAQSRRGYGNLAHWITVARRRAPKGSYRRLARPTSKARSPPPRRWPACPIASRLLVPDRPSQSLRGPMFAHAMWLKTWCQADRASIAVSLLRRRWRRGVPGERVRPRRAEFTGLPIVADRRRADAPALAQSLCRTRPDRHATRKPRSQNAATQLAAECRAASALAGMRLAAAVRTRMARQHADGHGGHAAGSRSHELKLRIPAKRSSRTGETPTGRTCASWSTKVMAGTLPGPA